MTEVEGDCPTCDRSTVLDVDMTKRTRHYCESCEVPFFFYPDKMEVKPTRTRWELTDKGHAYSGMVKPNPPSKKRGEG